MRENRSLGSVRAKAKWLSYSTTIFSTGEYGNFLWAQVSLKTLVIMFQGGLGAADWPSFENVDAMTQLWLLLKKCPDEAISEQTAGLPFIEDESLRISVLLDISSAENAFNNGEWKAATVLAAAAVEALLLWSLNQRSEPERQSAIQNLNLRTQCRAAGEREPGDVHRRGRRT